jgi:hypothetical protein
VVTLRCTASLLKRLRAPAHEGEATGRLGDWSARHIGVKHRNVVLCTNERSLLCVVVPLAPMAQLVERFVIAATHRISQIPAPAHARSVEVAALQSALLGRTRNRSVISSMNQFSHAIQIWLDERPTGELDDLGFWLCDTPCSAISTHWPWLQAELLLTGVVEPGPRPLKHPWHVL